VNCPMCKEPGAARIIYMGFPMWFCEDGQMNGEQCSCLWGFWSWIPDAFGFNGFLFRYEGSYPRALFYWLFGDWSGE